MFGPLLANPDRLISRVLLDWYGPGNIHLDCNDLHNLKIIGLTCRFLVCVAQVLVPASSTTDTDVNTGPFTHKSDNKILSKNKPVVCLRYSKEVLTEALPNNTPVVMFLPDVDESVGGKKTLKLGGVLNV